MKKTIFLAISAIILVICIIGDPNQAFQAALQGLTLWWNILFPGLLPFFMLFEMMLALGLFHAAGVWLRNSVSRCLRLPGEAVAALILGWLGGFPSGAHICVKLLNAEVLNKQQAQRLLALSHMPSPLFILLIIGTSFLKQQAAAWILLTALWLAGLCLALLSTLRAERLPEKKNVTHNSNLFSPTNPKIAKKATQRSLLTMTALAMKQGREEDGRNFGAILGDSVSSSVNKLMSLGGFVIFAAVLSKISTKLIISIVATLPIPVEQISAFGWRAMSALFESHLGSYAAASQWFPLALPWIAALLAWTGLSGILQTSHAITGTSLRIRPFIGMRLAHSGMAFVFAWQIEKMIKHLFPEYHLTPVAPAMQGGSTSSSYILVSDLPPIWHYSAAALLTLLACCWITYAWQRQTR